MKAFFLLMAMAVAGGFAYPAWHEQTDSACGALEKRAGQLANAEMQGPALLGHQAMVNGLMRDSSGGIAEAALGSALPGVPPAVACTIGYWRLTLSPSLGQMLASVH